MQTIFGSFCFFHKGHLCVVYITAAEPQRSNKITSTLLLTPTDFSLHYLP